MEQEYISGIRNLVEQHQAPLCRFAARLLRDPDSAKDVVQEAFISYLRISQEADEGGISNVLAWLYRVTRNKCLDRLKSARARYEQPQAENMEFQSSAPGPDSILEKDEMIEAIRKKIAQLPEREKEILVLKLEHDRSYKEIAEITGLTVTNVGFILHTAIKRLAKELREEGVSC